MTPKEAQVVWERLLQKSATDEQANAVLNDILTSAVIDYITIEMEHNDEYALVIANRIRMLSDAVAFGKSHGPSVRLTEARP